MALSAKDRVYISAHYFALSAQAKKVSFFFLLDKAQKNELEEYLRFNTLLILQSATG